MNDYGSTKEMRREGLKILMGTKHERVNDVDIGVGIRRADKSTQVCLSDDEEEEEHYYNMGQYVDNSNGSGIHVAGTSDKCVVKLPPITPLK